MLESIGEFCLKVILIIIVLSLYAFLVMWIWNIHIPEILGTSSINYYQSVNLVSISYLLYGASKLIHKI